MFQSASQRGTASVSAMGRNTRMYTGYIRMERASSGYQHSARAYPNVSIPSACFVRRTHRALRAHVQATSCFQETLQGAGQRSVTAEPRRWRQLRY